eukprot:1180289-Prorocentrum_minimum.AAC.2
MGDALRGARGPEDDIESVRRSCGRTCGLCIMPDAPLEVRAPIAEGGREYTRGGHQSRKGGENTPAV